MKGNFYCFGKLVVTLLEVLVEFAMGPACERGETGQQLVEQTAQRPYVGFVIISSASEYFWSHEQGCPTSCFRKFIFFQFTGEPQICNLHGYLVVLSLKLKFAYVLRKVKRFRDADVPWYILKMDHHIRQL